MSLSKSKISEKSKDIILVKLCNYTQKDAWNYRKKTKIKLLFDPMTMYVLHIVTLL